jgi:hypothetical protein
MKDYKKILGGVVDIINTTEKSDIGFANICAYIGENCPELKESKDERIMRCIGMCLTDANEQRFIDYSISLKDCLDWLKKQGEQNPANKEYTFKAIPRLLEMIQPTDRAKSYCQKLIDSLEQEGYITDAKIVSDCLKQMNGEKVAMATMDEQKPAWSEEDEKIKESIITGLEMLKDGASDKSLIALYNKKIDWLKSLSPQNRWKPTEEQMRQLHKYCPDNRPLTLLYEQLKKLREE